MKNYILIVLVVFVSACGKTPEVGLPASAPADSKNAIPVQIVSTTTTCKGVAVFLDVKSAAMVIVNNSDGSSSITCSLIDSNGVETKNSVNYPTDMQSQYQGADVYFSFCKIYYKNKANLTFAISGPGFNPGEQALKGTDYGFQIMGVPATPGSEIDFSSSDCEEK